VRPEEFQQVGSSNYAFGDGSVRPSVWRALCPLNLWPSPEGRTDYAVCRTEVKWKRSSRMLEQDPTETKQVMKA